MNWTDRDRRIILILLPIVILLAYWFLLLSPKRSDLSDARNAQHQAEQARDQAVATASQLEHARQSFAADYAALIRLGKAIPATVDSPSLLVQLDRAANGTHIDFASVTFGERLAAAPAAAGTTATGGAQPPAQPAGNAAAGGAPAQTAPGGAVESAGNTVQTGNQAAQAAGGGTTTTTATSASGAAQTGSSTTTSAPLDQVAVTFNFSGTYFDLADFFHRLKRYVYVAGNRIFIRGRLLTIDTLTFAPSGGTGTGVAPGRRLTATVGATIYLSPKSQGVAGGATPAGPAGATTTTPAPGQTAGGPVPVATVGAR